MNNAIKLLARLTGVIGVWERKPPHPTINVINVKVTADRDGLWAIRRIGRAARRAGVPFLYYGGATHYLTMVLIAPDERYGGFNKTLHSEYKNAREGGNVKEDA